MSGRQTPEQRKKRIEECFKLRFGRPEGLKYHDWLDHCRNTYGDKSEITYWEYWDSASSMYKENWQAKLNNMIDPAVNELYKLLADENPKIRQKAIDQIIEYSGNKVQKIDANVNSQIKVKFGDTE